MTYGGFLLLGGRAADLLGRRRTLVAGTIVFALCSLAGGLAANAGMLVGARVAQGVGAALMAPAGLSILTTTFTEERDRTRALGVWGAISGLGAAVGVFGGGVLAEGPGWRWVLFVNIPVCVAIVAAAYRLIPAERLAGPRGGFDISGAILAWFTGMLLGIYALVKAPDTGWGTARTIGELTTAGLLLALQNAPKTAARVADAGGCGLFSTPTPPPSSVRRGVIFRRPSGRTRRAPPPDNPIIRSERVVGAVPGRDRARPGTARC